MRERDSLLRSLDDASRGFAAIEHNVLLALADGGSGWFGLRIKVHSGRTAVVQVTTDQELCSTEISAAKRKRN